MEVVKAIVSEIQVEQVIPPEFAGTGYKSPPPQTKGFAAATAGGYPQSDILESLLARGEVSKRVTAMCADAMDAAGDERMGCVFAGMRAELKGGAQ